MSTAVMIAVLVSAVLFCVALLYLLFTLIPALRQLHRFLDDAEKTSAEVRHFCQQLERLGGDLEAKIEQASGILHSAQKVVDQTGSALNFVNQGIFKKSTAWLAFLPALRLGWKLVKRMKKGGE